MTAATDAQPAVTGEGPAVALFVTCLVDLFRPEVGFATLRLLEDSGCRVYVPRSQTCCGQPGYNNGDYEGARAIARDVIRSFEAAEFVVVPSGSCAGMLIHHYPKLLEGIWRERAEALAERTWELTTFLSDVLPGRASAPVAGTLPAVAYHDGCAGLRELGVRDQPRRLLAEGGIAVRELEQAAVCCGFGGTFCAKMPAISAKMADDKLRDAVKTGADTLVAGDLGCLLALAGRASREGVALSFRHVAEVLDGRLEAPPIGEGSRG
ncbi:(Fe-S)-binding protein [Pseudohaliea rubra]|uniref:Putative L-lactate dehydrogenase, Fe-S oxidoreductase subunit YkgE n=1 Tax=Pseudohaliea rubra DSM 19751 TaxID=1265313 RepID=A0A095XVY7_9GAMM|nr:(Fe-S)-binding protein [Pseudohaliea rubra]KGE03866.1 putative L-lactate dehydrogenase, Fe-S oxidoreductase subunit YkgE [Pseudohaliea rubra DSM 19751]